ncbi:hypothetical protein Cci01nite_62110 [Catellatospora citrea]|uniref:Uncharacterized protein n=1 Tax=Catellatospora citrea TaxID=53366 RepID=A0A8J3KDU7_9ACTN|nr:hypothetical protein Cci01nite_62110 [Catellatospora citrea]
MPELPAARDDSAVEHQPTPELSREPRVGAQEARDARDADGADGHESHDPYQPL